mmetsp:Transcript_20555/g.48952  ORF Transcript_20555/g.48952 Transcript_20555/m.48952 type:complete len:201 (-) Transcript_20555:8-610(-)
MPARVGQRPRHRRQPDAPARAPPRGRGRVRARALPDGAPRRVHARARPLLPARPLAAAPRRAPREPRPPGGAGARAARRPQPRVHAARLGRAAQAGHRPRHGGGRRPQQQPRGGRGGGRRGLRLPGVPGAARGLCAALHRPDRRRRRRQGRRRGGPRHLRQRPLRRRGCPPPPSPSGKTPRAVADAAEAPSCNARRGLCT